LLLGAEEWQTLTGECRSRETLECRATSGAGGRGAGRGGGAGGGVGFGGSGSVGIGVSPGRTKEEMEASSSNMDSLSGLQPRGELPSLFIALSWQVEDLTQIALPSCG
jgi:hypothetical protein